MTQEVLSSQIHRLVTIASLGRLLANLGSTANGNTVAGQTQGNSQQLMPQPVHAVANA
jgi:hypothetical protein